MRRHCPFVAGGCAGPSAGDGAGLRAAAPFLAVLEVRPVERVLLLAVDFLADVVLRAGLLELFADAGFDSSAVSFVVFLGM